MWRIAPHPGVPLAPEEVQKYMDTVRRFPARSRARRFFHQLLCEMSAHSGEHARALESLATSVSAGLEDLAWIDLCPALEPLRGYPELAAARAAVAPRAEAIRRAWEER